MLKEIYLRTPQEPKFNETKIEVGSQLEAYLSKLRMILFTDAGDVLFDPEIGIGLESLLFEFNANERQIQQKFQQQIFKYCPEAKQFDTNIRVNFIKGEARDIGIIDIFVDSNPEIRIIAR